MKAKLHELANECVAAETRTADLSLSMETPKA